MGICRKAEFLKKRKKDRLWVANGLLQWFCKGWGESAKQGGVVLQRWGGNAKETVGGVKTQKDFESRKRTAGAALMRSDINTL